MLSVNQSKLTFLIVFALGVFAAKKPEVCELDVCKPYIPKPYPRNCAEAYARNQAYGIQLIQVDSYGPYPFYVYCVRNATMIQKRTRDSLFSFNRTWEHYKYGFGDLNGDFFLGLEKIHALTTDLINDLYIVYSDSSYMGRYIRYDVFVVGTEHEQYAIQALGDNHGDAGDGLSHQAGAKFSTVDRNNCNGSTNCAGDRGGWWFYDCTETDMYTNLNNLTWADIRGSISRLSRADIQIRPTSEYYADYQ